MVDSKTGIDPAHLGLDRDHWRKFDVVAGRHRPERLMPSREERLARRERVERTTDRKDND